MTKRSSGKFKRNPRDFYRTPRSAVAPLLPFLPPKCKFNEPCAGDGSLVDALELAGHHCMSKSDIEPQRADIARYDAFNIEQTISSCFITNSPWERSFLHNLIVHLSDMAPTWLLFDADWPHTIQSRPYMERCSKIVSVGRVSWMENGISGFDNCCWFMFTRPEFIERTVFHGR